MSAEIVAFPARLARPASGQPPGHAAPHLEDSGQDRLRRALTTLNAASSAQHQAVGQWRQALSDLQASLHRLESRLLRTRDMLDQLQANVGDLHDRARGLERWATQAERQGHPGSA